MRAHRAGSLLPIWLTCALLAITIPTRAVVSITAGPDGQGIVINTLLGADRFYNNGYFGQNAIVANIEAGAIWNGHETLDKVTTYITDPTLVGTTQIGQFDYHATAVGMAIGGLHFDDQGNAFYYQLGMAPLVNLWSGSIATHFNGDGSFDITEHSFIYAYKEAMQVGRDVTVNLGGGISVTTHATADVVNSSWGFDNSGGDAFEAIAIDALAAANHVTFVASAGNSGPAGNTVGAPASGFNKIAVASLAADTTANPYTTASTFSSRGPNDFVIPAAPGNSAAPQVIHNVRPVVDIAAPGEELALAYYGGATGTNAGGTDSTDGANNFYLTNAAGTSFAAPLVAGGAALLADYAHVNFGADGSDPRVTKAVLLNSADKTSGWDNGQHLNIANVIVTDQALDWTTGAGRMNLDRAYDQFTSGTTDTPTLTGGHVQPVGWALGRATQGQRTTYLIDTPLTTGETFTATLTWFVQRTFTDATDTTDAAATDDRFDNLELQVLLLAANGFVDREVAESDTLYDNVQHVSFTIPQDGQYIVRVLFEGQQYDYTTEPAGPLSEDFGIAWSNLPVPEPAGLLPFFALAIVLLTHRRLALRFRRPLLTC